MQLLLLETARASKLRSWSMKNIQKEDREVVIANVTLERSIRIDNMGKHFLKIR